MEKYYIIGNGSNYLSTIYNTSISSSSHDKDAIRVKNIEEANVLCAIANRLTSSSLTYVVYCVETTISKINNEG